MKLTEGVNADTVHEKLNHQQFSLAQVKWDKTKHQEIKHKSKQEDNPLAQTELAYTKRTSVHKIGHLHKFRCKLLTDRTRRPSWQTSAVAPKVAGSHPDFPSLFRSPAFPAQLEREQHNDRTSIHGSKNVIVHYIITPTRTPYRS